MANMESTRAVIAQARKDLSLLLRHLQDNKKTEGKALSTSINNAIGTLNTAIQAVNNVTGDFTEDLS